MDREAGGASPLTPDGAWPGYELVETERAALRQLLDVLPTPVVVYAADGRVLLANRARAELVGDDLISLETAVSRTTPRHEDGRPFTQDELPALRALAGETVTGVRIRLRTKAGDDAVMLANASPLRDSAGAVAAAVLVFSDITAISELERRRRELFSMANHDLRTPLTGIQGFAQLARRHVTTDPRRAENELAKIERECARMLRLTRDLLDVARFETGAIPIHPEPHDIVEHVRRAVARHEVDDRITCSVPEGELRVRYDGDRIDQVLDNLLSNALRHTLPGTRVHVTVAAACAEVLVRVRDAGRGVAPEERGRLFTAFYQTPRGRSYGGTGLGLHVSRRIVEAHGGRLWLEDTGPDGSTFALALPS